MTVTAPVASANCSSTGGGCRVSRQAASELPRISAMRASVMIPTTAVAGLVKSDSPAIWASR